MGLIPYAPIILIAHSAIPPSGKEKHNILSDFKANSIAYGLTAQKHMLGLTNACRNA
ncbi:hypothetical protein DPMN_123125 [Dreissena polymorpha]|uniref:Uncharacterized protein n=1 Tax=Dreissena polymorpha TaxID=45954 RepID=A0A9D4JR80_DREPO|nr:hypothetical protein DPMN_123125 [Dreissena polymorpha]